MKEHYQRGGLGDVKTKRYLLEILERELGPIANGGLNLLKIWDKSMICFKRVVKWLVRLQQKRLIKSSLPWD